MAVREPDAGLEPQLPTTRRELGLLPAPASSGQQEAGSQGSRAPVRRTDFHYCADLITSQKLHLLRHHLGPKVFSLQEVGGRIRKIFELAAQLIWHEKQKNKGQGRELAPEGVL